MLIINLEGLDGCGKSTQIEAIKNHYESMGKTVHHIHFPNYETPIGNLIGQVLRKEVEITDPTAFQLLYAADRHENMKKIPKCDVLIVDRYVMSSMVYGGTHGANENITTVANHQLSRPHIIFFLDVSPEAALSRDTSGDLYNTMDNFKKVRELYLRAAENDKCIKIDASVEPELVTAQLLPLLPRI